MSTFHRSRKIINLYNDELIVIFFRMSFFDHEISALKELFPDKTATLEKDLEPEELVAVQNLGVLKFDAHLYLGKENLHSDYD